jgi:nucleoside-diphosphate-sugar epimerase
MGGMGFMTSNKAASMLSVLINTHLLMASRDLGIRRFFFASSAGVYNIAKQEFYDVAPLKEGDVYPAMPEDGYGWEKLFSERMCRHFREDYGVNTRIGRYHNIYGPFCDYDGGRERAPAAICRKVAYAKLNGLTEIEVWGDGNQTRSFTYIDDCIEGTIRLMTSDVVDPMNIGSEEVVSINQLVDLVANCAGVVVEKFYSPGAPRGVAGRNSDNTMIRNILGWSPSIPLEQGIAKTYSFVEQQVLASGTAFMGSTKSKFTLLVESP